MAYETYLNELSLLATGERAVQASVKISVRRSYADASTIELAAHGLAPSSLKVAVFAARASKGSRALVVIPIRPTEEIDDITDGASATAIGILEVGHAVALKIGNRVLMPAGPATRPAFRVPKL